MKDAIVLLYVIWKVTIYILASFDMLLYFLTGRYSLRDPAFQSVSKDGISFIQSLLQKDYKQRVTSAEVLKLPWLNPSLSISSKSSASARLAAHTTTASSSASAGHLSPTSAHRNNRVLNSEKSVFAFKNLAKSVKRNDLQRTASMALVFGLQPRQAVNMRALFQSCDLDGSGALSLDEFQVRISVTDHMRL
jgi:serine/threonine protein kinase